MYKIKMLPLIYDTCMYAYHVGVYDVAGRVKEENHSPPLPSSETNTTLWVIFENPLLLGSRERHHIFDGGHFRNLRESIVNAHGD